MEAIFLKNKIIRTMAKKQKPSSIDALEFLKVLFDTVIPLIKNNEDKNLLLLERFIVYTFQNHLLMLKMKNKELKYSLLKEGEKYLLWKYKDDILQSYNDVLLHLFINDFINQYHLKLNDIKHEE